MYPSGECQARYVATLPYSSNGWEDHLKSAAQTYELMGLRYSCCLPCLLPGQEAREMVLDSLVLIPALSLIIYNSGLNYLQGPSQC